MFSNQTPPKTHEFFAANLNNPNPFHLGPFSLRASADRVVECRNAVDRGKARRRGLSAHDLDRLSQWYTTSKRIQTSRSTP